MNRWKIIKAVTIALLVTALVPSLMAQKPYRQGTTAANFLEIGYGTAGSAMGDAYVSLGGELSSVYWNPAGLAFMPQNEVVFNTQPWLLDITSTFVSAGLVMPALGNFAISYYQMGYGEMEVTTMDMQEGTGENFSANDYAVGLSYGRKLADWFSFGVTAKYISSQIWHVNANAMAADLGVIIQTQFFSPSGDRADGLNIGMSISNFGTKMKYEGMDLLNPIDILPNEQGNYQDVAGEFKTEGWELPQIFRIGISVNPIATSQHRLTLAVDALHPNNNSESLNVGGQYALTMPGAGTFFLRGGYKALGMEDSEYGMSFGGGMVLNMMNNVGIKIEYAYRDIGLLGKVHSYSLGVLY